MPVLSRRPRARRAVLLARAPAVRHGSAFHPALLPPLLVALAGSQLAAQVQGPPQPLLLRAKTIVISPDEQLADGRILLRGGKVAAVGTAIPAELGADVVQLDLGDVTVVPGLVVPHAHLAPPADLAETADAYTPELRAVEAYDPFGDEVRDMLAGGVTTAAAAPRSANTFAGLGGVVKTGPAGGAILREQAYAKVALVPESLDQQRFPTSRMGALELVRTAFAAANSNTVSSTADRQVLRDVLSGGLPLVVHARTRDEIECALDLVDPARDGVLSAGQPRLVLVGAREAHECLDRLAAANASVWLEPLRPGLEDDELALPGRLAGRGIPLAFAADSPAELRLSVALAVRHGLPRKTALAALTQSPAALLGVDDRVGTLQQGRDADLVVFTGDPIDLAARVVAVCIAGRPVVAGSLFSSDH